MRFIRCVILGVFWSDNLAYSQSLPNQVEPILSQRIQAAEVTEYLLREYAMAHVVPLSAPQSPQQWTSEANRLRRHIHHLLQMR